MEIPDDDDEVKAIGHLTKDIVAEESEHQLDSIMDHVNGYPKIYNFTLFIDWSIL